MSQLTPVSSRKRLLPDDEGMTDDLNICDTTATKRQRLLSSITASSSILYHSTPCNNGLSTPPVSAKRTTMALKLVIPQAETSHEQLRKLTRHRADAERWKPKLERPYPKKAEIKLAYPLKLMRHYSDTSAPSEPNFVRPRIDESPRVSRLLEQFPLINTTESRSQEVRCSSGSDYQLDQMKPLSSRVKELSTARKSHEGLQNNIHITQTEHAQQLAWQSFSQTEHDLIDRGREAMMQSGLLTDDLKMESVGQVNRLPEWRKVNTGRFAPGPGAAR